MEENKRLKDCDSYELIKELRERDDVIDVTVWMIDDIKSALEYKGYIPTEERVCEVVNEMLGCDLVHWDYCWEIFYDAVDNCDFGDCDYEEEQKK